LGIAADRGKVMFAPAAGSPGDAWAEGSRLRTQAADPNSHVFPLWASAGPRPFENRARN